MKALKVFTTIITGFTLIFTIVAPALAQAEERKCMITAYYSPLPDQNFYIMGDYEAEKRFNGNGTNGASGAPVFTGMLAAPKSIPFGTRVTIPNLGTGEVQDRGGRIIVWGEGEEPIIRLDVWTGKGEAGLARALYWGARHTTCQFHSDPNSVQVNLDYSWLTSELPSHYINKPKVKTENTPETNTKKPEVIEVSESAEVIENSDLSEAENKEIKRLKVNQALLVAGLGPDSQNSKDVEHLQLTLWELGYYKGEITGEYDQMTIDAVYEFQLDHQVINGTNEPGAGYFGPKTFKALMEVIGVKMEVLAKHPKETQVWWSPAKTTLPRVANLELPEVSTERQLNFSEVLLNKKIVHSSAEPVSSKVERVGMTNSSSELDLYDRSEEVLKLQRFLIENGHLAQGFDTGYYGSQTQAAVLKFQLEKGIVGSADDLGAGRVGPRTLAAMN